MGPKILTVDDSRTIRMIVAKAFKTFDCEVLEAANGVEGLALAQKEKPDIIILDLTMPVMDGYETLTKLKANPDLKAIPVVMLTAEAGRDNVLRIAKQGVRDYLIKPFKEELIVERVSRIIDLKPRGLGPAQSKRYDDPLGILVVDDKPAIAQQIRSGLAGSTWSVHAAHDPGDTLALCSQALPDVVLISLSLPQDIGFNLFQMLRASPRTKTLPVFGLCVRTASDDQTRAQQMGFSGIVTKPIDLDELRAKIARILNLDTSYKYFERRDGILLLKVPPVFTPATANEITVHLRLQFCEAVDAGIDKLVLDLSALRNTDLSVIKLGLEVSQLCQELSLRHRVIGSAAVQQECKNYEETKDWRFVPSFEEAFSSPNPQYA